MIQNPNLLMDLIEGLESPDKVIRMRTAHALEVISRNNPGIIEEIKKQLTSSAYKDKLPETATHSSLNFGWFFETINVRMCALLYVPL